MSRGYPFQGDHEAALRVREPQHPRLNSLPTGVCILTRKGEAPARTACNLELATDFGGMHLPSAVKGLSVLCRVLLTRHPRDESSRRSSRSGAEPAPRPTTNTGRGDQIVSRDTRVRECDLIMCCVASPNVLTERSVVVTCH